MENKTKDELIEVIEELQEKVEQLENDVDYWKTEYDDVEEQREELETQIEDLTSYDGIKNIDNFIFKLKTENMYTDELKEFIENYLKFYND